MRVCAVCQHQDDGSRRFFWLGAVYEPVPLTRRKSDTNPIRKHNPVMRGVRLVCEKCRQPRRAK